MTQECALWTRLRPPKTLRTYDECLSSTSSTKNRRQPSVPDYTAISKGAYPKTVEVSKHISGHPSSAQKLAGEIQNRLEYQQQSTSYSATDEIREGINKVLVQTIDAKRRSRQEILTRNTGHGSVTFAGDIWNNALHNEDLPVENVPSPDEIQMQQEAPIFPLALGPTLQQLAARQILPL